MTTSKRSLLVASLLVALLLSPAAFAAPRTHDGLYLRLGAGADRLQMQRTVTVGGSEANSSIGGNGPTFAALIGGTVGKRLVVGGGLVMAMAVAPRLDREAGSDADLATNLHLLMAGPLLDWYPSAESGFHFGGMAGFAGVIGEAPGEQTLFERVGGNGGGLSLHAGYDFWISDEWLLGPELRFFGARVTGTDDRSSQTLEEASTIGGLGLSFVASYN